MFPNRFTLLAAALVSFPFFLTGYEVTSVCGHMIIQKSFNTTNIDNFEDSVQIFMMGGTLVGGVFINYVGRKYPLFLGATMYTVGVLLFSLAHHFVTYKVGRSFMGIGIGVGLAIGPVYIVEISPAHHRGFLGSLPQLLLCMGTIVGYLVQYAFSHISPSTDHGWRLMEGLPFLQSIVHCVLLLFWLPESPCFLVIKGKLKDATNLLKQNLQTPEDEVDHRITQLKKAANIPDHITADHNTRNFNRSDHGGIPNMWGQLFRDSMGTLFFVGALHIAQVMTGEYILLSDLTLTVAMARGPSFTSYLVANLMLACTKMLFSFLPLFLVDRVGRTAMLIVSMSVTMVATAILGVSVVVNQHGHITDETAFKYYIVGALVLEAGIGVGIGGIPWLYGAEAFKLPARAMGVALGVAPSQLLGWLVGDKEVSIYDYRSLGKAGKALLVSSGVMLVAAVFCVLFMKNLKKTTRTVLVDADAN